MKKELVSLILAGFLLFTLPSVGQNTKYPTKKVNGIEYYIYKVQVSEGLFAIGRKFDLAPDDIAKANPYIKNGLKAGEEILIPVHHSSEKKAQAETKSTPKFIEHKVAKKQTLFAISRLYNVSQEDIVKYNPIVQNGFKEGLILKIPVAVKDTKPAAAKETIQVVAKDTKAAVSKETKPLVAEKAKPAASQLRTHIVKPNETLFSISKRYNVEIKDVVKLNPGAEKTIEVGSELKIPALVTKKTESTKATTTPRLVPDTRLVSSKQPTAKVTEKRTIRLAFLLPFMLNESKRDTKLERFQNFYGGALIAIQQAKQRGISFEIYTFDTEASDERINEILANPELKTVDLIIGPAFTSQVSFVTDFAKENKINTLIPFSSKVTDIDSNPYLFQFNPGIDSEIKYLTELVNGKYKYAHIVFADIQGVSSSDDDKVNADALRKQLQKSKRTFSKLELTSAGNTSFANVLKKTGKNLVIFNTDKYSSAAPYINALKQSAGNADYSILKPYSWKLQTEKMPKSIFISPFMTNQNAESVYMFEQQFDQYYGRDASKDTPRYDLLGYDLTNYFVTLIQRYGNKFGTKISAAGSINGIQSQPLFERSSTGSGFINQRVYVGEDKAQ